MTTEEDKKFVEDIITFYDAFLGSVAKAIEDLAKIQEKHREGYDKLKEVQMDPTKLSEKFKSMNAKERGALLDFFLRSAAFEKRLVMLFKLSAEEQRQLAKELKEFLEESNFLLA